MYTDHYGLSARPFQLTPDPHFYFESATHKKAMAYLGYGLQQGEGFIVVTGEIGAGKTTLVGHLMEEVDPARVLAVKIVSTNVASDDVLRLVANAFGIVSEGATKAQLLDRIEQFLQGRAREGRKVLLIVDEAQNLPTGSLEELRMLSNFQAGSRALLQIFLLGQPEFRDKVASPELEQLRQRVIATHHLMPIDASEVGPYIEHRLKLVGWTTRPHFTPDAYAALHTASGGIPRRLNGYAERALLHGAIENLDAIDGKVINAVVDDHAADERLMSAPPPSQAAQVAAMAPAVAPVIATTSLSEKAPHPATLDLAARTTMLEAQVEEQGVALRRVLSLLIDWVEQEGGAAHAAHSIRSPAA
jgi:putative secretion ATPase (PEP-CTERM system associated)